MQDVARLLNHMVADGVVTMDADALVGVRNEQAIDIRRPIYEYCAARGLHAEAEAVRVGSWPVQFVPVFSSLTRAAMHGAETQDLDGVPIRVVSSDHLAAVAHYTGRAKDYARVLALLEAKTTTPVRLAKLAADHGLDREWAEFRRRFLAP